MKKMKLNIQLFGATCTVSVTNITQNIVNNYSTITIHGRLATDSYSYNYGGAYMEPVISNQPIIGNQSSSQTLAKYKYNLSKSSSKEDDWTFIVYHNSDGTCNNLTIAINWYVTNSTNGTAYVNGGYTPTTIPRASEVTANDGTLNQSLSISISRKADTFVHTLRYVCGDASGWIADSDHKVTTSATWTPPLSLASQNQTGNSVSCGIFCQTYSSNGDLIGVEDVVTISLTIPNLPPTSVSISSPTDYNSYKNTYGAFIQNKSRIRATLSGTPQYTTIKNYIWQIRQTNSSGTLLASGTGAIIDYLPTTNGTIYISGTIVDNRDKSTSTSTSVSVTAYSEPTCQLDVSRIDNTSADYIATGSGTTINNVGYTTNTVTYILKRDSTTIATWNGNSLNQTGTDTILDQSYTYTLTAQDTISNITDTKEVSISTTFTLMNFSSDGTSMAIGKASENSGNTPLLEIAMDTDITGDTNADGNLNVTGNVDIDSNLNVDGNTTLTGTITLNNSIILSANSKISLLNAIYPIGSIYMSVNNVSPASFLGGTWEQLKDRFLLGAGTTYTNGSTGGEATHTLTESEMPSHKHNNSTNDFPTWHSSSHTGGLTWNTTNGWHAEQLASHFDSKGGNQPHNNMPPYLVVYMWKRTA